MQFILSFGHFGHFTDYKAGRHYYARVIKSGRQFVRYPIFALLANHTGYRPSSLCIHGLVCGRMEALTEERQRLVRKVRET
jgi:hypothetical protein